MALSPSTVGFITRDFHALISRQHSQTNRRSLYTLFLTSKSRCMQKFSSVDALLTAQNVLSWSGRFGGGHTGWSQLQLASSFSPLWTLPKVMAWCPHTLRPRPLQWRHNGHDNVLIHCLLNRLFRRRSKKTSKLRVTGLCAGISPGTGEFPAQMSSNTENVSIWWRHHGDRKAGQATTMIFRLLTHICVAWPQWVKSMS